MKRAVRSAPQRAPAISIRNRQRAVRVDLEELQRFAERALALCLQLRGGRQNALTKLLEIHFFLISDRKISQLHRRFFQIETPTDVITFQHGEIFISVQTARRQACEFRTSFLREIQLYIVHGLLHLHGFNDKTQEGARLMNATQKQIFRAALKQLKLLAAEGSPKFLN